MAVLCSAGLAGGRPEVRELATGPIVQEAPGIVGRAAEMRAGRPVQPRAEYLGEGRWRTADAHAQKFGGCLLAGQQYVLGVSQSQSGHDRLLFQSSTLDPKTATIKLRK